MISKLEKKLKNLAFDLPNENLPQAAILILLIENQNDLSIVFTERSKSLPSHAGEVSFPGGKREAEDEDLIETALRETQEEIGINPKQINILGRMDTKESRFGLSVSPFIGYASGNLEFIKETKEVDTIFFVPLNYLKDKPSITNKVTNASGETFETPVLNYDSHKIWGLTLGFTLQFLKIIEIDIEIDDLYFRKA